jgi:hypothetical protein
LSARVRAQQDVLMFTFGIFCGLLRLQFSVWGRLDRAQQDVLLSAIWAIVDYVKLES